MRIESYSGAQLTVAQRQYRQARGLSEVPQLAIVTRSGHLDRDMPVFTRTEVPPLVLTCTAALDETRQRLAGLADVVDCSGDDPAGSTRPCAGATGGSWPVPGLDRGRPDAAELVGRTRPARRAVSDDRAVCRGRSGPPHHDGPGQVLTRMRCVHVLADESGYLYTRYVKA
ncbi:ribD C-terminal domain protein [Mycobacterium xenopi 4042]|uniref:RibD C-terminal domain protein n=1 Tax=Mycobacterium xenopi 4042 TaxID=1299334 RepID=X8CHB8_MYCXE|nr:ribD C-terminal domain protein [Mycobacterium xenopi 4042]